MDGRFNNPYGINQEDSENLSDNSGDHLPFSVPEGRLASSTTSSQKRSRRAVQKRVVTLPIGDVDGARIKGDGAPPYDSWAWRKYGQKPIKGSPYPRGYYRCSSSKGCPARKQVERSRVDPTMLVITYACDHNHSGPPSRNPSSTTTTTTTTAAAATATRIASPKSEPDESAIFTTQTDSDEKFADLGADEPLIASDDGFTWFSEVASTSETTTRVMDLLESPIYSGTSNEDVADDVAMIFPMGEEDESLFADLGELPECSVVFSRGFLDQEKRRRCSLRAG